MAKFADVFKEYKENGTGIWVSVGDKKGFAGKVIRVGDDFVELKGTTVTRFYNFCNIIYVEEALAQKREKQTDIF